MLKFKLIEDFVQEIMVNETGEDKVMPQQKMNHSELEISDFSVISSDNFVRMTPEPGVIPDTPFDTLWSMVITLEPSVQKRKEIWFV